jgi:hypothetical protein
MKLEKRVKLPLKIPNIIIHWDQKTKGRGFDFHRDQANFSVCPTAETVGKAAISRIASFKPWGTGSLWGNPEIVKFGK